MDLQVVVVPYDHRRRRVRSDFVGSSLTRDHCRDDAAVGLVERIIHGRDSERRRRLAGGEHRRHGRRTVDHRACLRHLRRHRERLRRLAGSAQDERRIRPLVDGGPPGGDRHHSRSRGRRRRVVVDNRQLQGRREADIAGRAGGTRGDQPQRLLRRLLQRVINDGQGNVLDRLVAVPGLHEHPVRDRVADLNGECRVIVRRDRAARAGTHGDGDVLGRRHAAGRGRGDPNRGVADVLGDFGNGNPVGVHHRGRHLDRQIVIVFDDHRPRRRRAHFVGTVLRRHHRHGNGPVRFVPAVVLRDDAETMYCRSRRHRQRRRRACRESQRTRRRHLRQHLQRLVRRAGAGHNEEGLRAFGDGRRLRFDRDHWRRRVRRRAGRFRCFTDPCRAQRRHRVVPRRLRREAGVGVRRGRRHRVEHQGPPRRGAVRGPGDPIAAQGRGTEVARRRPAQVDRRRPRRGRLEARGLPGRHVVVQDHDFNPRRQRHVVDGGRSGLRHDLHRFPGRFNVGIIDNR